MVFAWVGLLFWVFFGTPDLWCLGFGYLVFVYFGGFRLIWVFLAVLFGGSFVLGCGLRAATIVVLWVWQDLLVWWFSFKFGFVVLWFVWVAGLLLWQFGFQAFWIWFFCVWCLLFVFVWICGCWLYGELVCVVLFILF